MAEIPRVAHIHVLVNKGGDGNCACRQPLFRIVIPQPLYKLMYVEQTGILRMWGISRLSSPVIQALVVMVTGVFHELCGVRLTVIFVDGKLNPPVVVDTVSGILILDISTVYVTSRFCFILKAFDVIDGLVIRSTYSPGHFHCLAAVEVYQYTVVVGIQVVQIGFCDIYQIALVAGAVFPLIVLCSCRHLHHYIVDATQGDGVGVVGVALGVVVVGVSVDIT